MEAGFTVIEILAEYIYFVLVGDKSAIDEIVEKCNSRNTDTSITYISTRLGLPSAIRCDRLQKALNAKVEIATGLESAQCFTYAEGFDKKTYMLALLEEGDKKFVLSFPKMELTDEDEPEDIILAWIKKRVGNVDRSIKKTIRPISLVGNNEEIIVYIAKLLKFSPKNKTKKMFKSFTQ